MSQPIIEYKTPHFAGLPNMGLTNPIALPGQMDRPDFKDRAQGRDPRIA